MKFDSNCIFAGLYDSKNPTQNGIRNILRKAELKFPVHIVSVELDHRDPTSLTLTSSKLKIWMIDSHRGILYIAYNGTPEDMEHLLNRRALLHGESQSCATAKQWIDVLRRSVVSVRHRYLSHLTDRNPALLTFANEQECRTIALKAIQHNLDWIKSVQHWLDITLIKHADYLYEVRRKCIEFISMVTMNIKGNHIASYHYIQGVQEIMKSHSLSDLREVTLQILINLQPQIMIDSEQVLSNDGYSEPIQKALGFISESYTTPIGVSEVCAKSFVTREHLSRQFKLETGYSVAEFLQLLRVSLAQQLLIETKKGLLEIGMDSGFNTAEQFHRTFKKHTDLTPHRYRKSHRI